jgi:hypothetical protein
MTDSPTKSSPNAPPSSDDAAEEEGSIFNKVRSDLFKRKLEGMLKDGVLKNLVSELKLPKELVQHLMSQVDETKHAAVSVISREVRRFFENTDLATELEKILSKFSFEVRTTVRFIPKEEKIQKARKPSASKARRTK